MSLSRLYKYKVNEYKDYEYEFIYYDKYEYSKLSDNLYFTRRGANSNHKKTIAEAFIMLDTETSKKDDDTTEDNHLVAFTISIRMYESNICTLWGRNPMECMKALEDIRKHMKGKQIVIYVHNLSYDYIFLRKFLFLFFGLPKKQFAIKAHYPLYIEFNNGIILKDSLILAQRKLETWAIDLNCEHKKAVGKWDYDKIRNQHEEYTQEELEYIEHDTLAGVECLNILANQLKKRVCELPLTATGILREEVRKVGKMHHAKECYNKQVLSFEQYKKAKSIFHGGYTHGNRFTRGIICGHGISFDFASSYPYVMLSEKFPCSKFSAIDDCKIDYILDYSEQYCFMLRLILINPKIKDDEAFPYIQHYKCLHIVDGIVDNGRVTSATALEIYTTEIGLEIIKQQYTYDEENTMCTDVEYAEKDYLPRWYTDLVYQQFYDKCTLKDIPGAELHYKLQKAKLNGNYGNMVMDNIKLDVVEAYLATLDHNEGEYYIDSEDEEAKYQKYINNKNNFLNYAWGVWVTQYAVRNLFRLISCVDGIPYYCDTDSCYASSFDMNMVNAYNAECKRKLLDNGYAPVVYNGKTFELGKAELDSEYDYFIQLHAKCYAKEKDGKMSITVAGVPKKQGAKSLNSLLDFKYGYCFSGETTGKLTHKYIYVNDIYTDKDGNITGDSVDLSPCDYILGPVKDDFNIMDRFIETGNIYTEDIYVKYEE